MLNKWDIKIISGGQTGADRAALDFALANNLPFGGWCPKGRKAEDGKIADFYPLIEMENEDYILRTKKNVLESDATIILFLDKPDEGTINTKDFCIDFNKPVLCIKLTKGLDYKSIINWIKSNDIKILNIAGPRESNEPGIYSEVRHFLKKLHNIMD